jgi:hypothetical protein
LAKATISGPVGAVVHFGACAGVGVGDFSVGAVVGDVVVATVGGGTVIVG